MNLSQKILNISPSLTLEINESAKEMKNKGYNVLNFGSGETDYKTPDYIKFAAISAIEDDFTKYTAVEGIKELREAVCEFLEEDIGVSYSPSEIMISNGAKQSIFNALYCILNPGDEVLLPKPYWISYPELIRLATGIPVFVPTYEKDNFRLKAKNIKPFVTNKTKVLIINSPNNPTGSVYNENDLREIAELVLEHDLIVISDEIYGKFIYDKNQHISISSFGNDLKERTVVINGVSKTFSMTGWRVGFSAGPERLINAMTNFQSHSTSNPNSIAQKASLEALNNPCKNSFIQEMISDFSNRKNYLVNSLNNIKGVSCLPPDGAFYVLMKIKNFFGKKFNSETIKNSVDFSKILLTNYKVATIPGVAFGADDYVRISYSISLESIKEGVKRIADFVKKLK